MRFLHVSDLHIGKRLHERSFLEDQKYILEQIIQIGVIEKVDALLIAGDIYDKSVPLEKGVALFDEFLTSCRKKGWKVFLISGNHDSSERIHFGGRIMEESGIYIQGTYEGKMQVTHLEDEYGKVDVYLLPFIKPSSVRPYYGEAASYGEAVQAALPVQPVSDSARNILVAHQFVTAGKNEPERCDSESVSVGGLDNVDAGIFADFDYVALGHLHMPQFVQENHIYYSGSPLKYSFSEAEIKGGSAPEKSVMIVTMEKEVTFRKVALKPMRDMRVIRGKIDELLKPEVYEKANTEDYLRVILTDEEELYEPLKKLRQVYPNILRLDFDNTRTRQAEDDIHLSAEQVENKSMIELFDEFYEKQNNMPMSEKQREFVLKLADGR